MIFNSQGDAQLKQYINGQTITPGNEIITLPGKAVLLDDVILEAVDREAIKQEGYNEGYTAGHEAGYEEGKAAALPYAKELAYIESSGTQCINTNIIPTNKTKVCIDYQLTATENNPNIFGARHSNGMFFAYFYTSGQFWATAYAKAWPELQKTSDSLSRCTMQFAGTGLMVNGNATTWSATTLNCPCSVYIFARNTNGTVEYYSKMRLYSCQIYEDGVIVRDYIPVLDFNGVPCLYDKAGKQFYYNAGSGSFSYA